MKQYRKALAIFAFLATPLFASGALAVSDPVYPFPASLTFLVGCNNCANDNGWAAAAIAKFGQNEGGVVYEYDFQNDAYKKIYVYLVPMNLGDTTIYVHRTKEVTDLNQTEISAFADVKAFKDGFIATADSIGAFADYLPRRSKNPLVAAAQAVGDYLIPSAKANGVTIYPPRVMNVSSSTCNSAYDYLTTSSARTALYKQWVAAGPPWAGALAKINAAGVGFNIEVVNFEDLRLAVKLKFNDGSQIKTIPNGNTDQMELVSKSAIDKDGNVIPDKKQYVPGNYYFDQSTIREFQGFVSQMYGITPFTWDTTCTNQKVAVVCSIDTSTGQTVCNSQTVCQ